MSTRKKGFTARKGRGLNIFLISLIFILIVLMAIILAYLWLKKDTQIATEPVKPSDYMDAIITVASSLIGIIAAVLAYRSLVFARNAEEGQLYVKMMERYDSKEMLDALKMLGTFKRENASRLDNAFRKWNIDYKCNRKEAIDLEQARRKVKYYYRDLMQLYQAGYFSKKWTKRILNTGGRHLFQEIVRPMEKYVNPYAFEDEFYPFDDFYAELGKEQVAQQGNPPAHPKKVCLIPARYDSTRFPGKLMKILGGRKTVIRVTYDRVKSMGIFDDVAVVTNSPEIRTEVESHGGKVIYIPREHNSGTDRIAEALQHIEADIIVNVQGDEPFVGKEPLEDILKVMNSAGDELYVASLMKPMAHEKEIESSNFVKVVCDKNDNALYFSRSRTPHQKNTNPKATYYEHIGVYAFTRSALLAFSSLEPTPLEQIESVECLRFLENGIPMKMVTTEYPILEIDTQEDLQNADEKIAKGELEI